MYHLASNPPEKHAKLTKAMTDVDIKFWVCTYQVSLPSFLYVVGSDDNGGLVHSYLKEVMPDPGEIINRSVMWQSHVQCFSHAHTHFDLSSGSTPTVGSSRMSRGGFWSMATANENLLCCPPLEHKQTMEEAEILCTIAVHSMSYYPRKRQPITESVGSDM